MQSATLNVYELLILAMQILENIYTIGIMMPGDQGSIPKSCQRIKKWYLIPPCLTLSITRYQG